MAASSNTSGGSDPGDHAIPSYLLFLVVGLIPGNREANAFGSPSQGVRGFAGLTEVADHQHLQNRIDVITQRR
jgi:hypothetical protein